MRKLLISLAGTVVLAACSSNTPDEHTGTAPETAPALIGFSVVNTYPHDTSFYTEGFEFYEGKLYESSGSGVNLEEKIKPDHPSTFGSVDLKTGRVTRKVNLDSTVYFGEGITFFNGKVYQLTWKNHQGFVYDAATFKKLGEFTYPGEGWAFTHDSTHLIMSDGSSNLQFIDPATLNGPLKAMNIVGVTDNNGPVSNINELEYINGYIYANQYLSNNILKIDPRNGKVVGKLVLDSIAEEIKRKNPDADVLNGLAWHPETNSLFVTGKLWPTIYEIKFN